MQGVRRFILFGSIAGFLYLPMSAMAMSKDEAIKQCLQEMKIPVSTAKQCKSSDWDTQACQDLKNRIKPCAKNKMFGS